MGEANRYLMPGHVIWTFRRPRLYKRDGEWVCLYNGNYGFGDDPVEAYESWRREQEHVDRAAGLALLRDMREVALLPPHQYLHA